MHAVVRGATLFNGAVRRCGAGSGLRCTTIRCSSLWDSGWSIAKGEGDNQFGLQQRFAGQAMGSSGIQSKPTSNRLCCKPLSCAASGTPNSWRLMSGSSSPIALPGAWGACHPAMPYIPGRSGLARRLAAAATDILLGCLLFTYSIWPSSLSDGRCRVMRWRSSWRRTRSSCLRARRVLR